MVLMDVCKGEGIQRKEAKEETVRPPLAPSEKNICGPNKPKTLREVPSRYKAGVTSSSPPTTGFPRRYPSPNVSRAGPPVVSSYAKRAQSAERRRPSTPSPSSRPVTPVQDASPEVQSVSKRYPTARTTESLWSSGTVRSLCVSFQSDTFSLPISKKEKPVNQTTLDHTLRSSANIAHRQAETPNVQRKATLERRKTPLRGRTTSDQSENSKPAENSHDRLIDQHRWPSTTGGKSVSIPSTRSSNLTDKASKSFSSPLVGRGVSPLRRSPASEVAGRGHEKPQAELAGRSSLDGNEGVEHILYANDDLRSSAPHKISSSGVGISAKSSSERAASTTRTWHSMPVPGSRLPSPSRTPLPTSYPSRGTLSPSRARPSAPFHASTSVTSQSSSSSSVLNFVSEYRKGKKGANHLEDAHQLRLLYNRYVQLRYANAQADVVLSNQRITAETSLYNVWTTSSELSDSVAMKRIELQQLREELKLNLVLTEQMIYLEEWALLDREHSSCVCEAIESLEACTLRLPVTAGAKVDFHSLKGAVCSAAEVMQAMVSSVCSLLSKVEKTNCLVTKLAELTAQEKALVHECGDLLASTATLQVEENSLRTHLIQLKQALRRRERSLPVVPPV